MFQRFRDIMNTSPRSGGEGQYHQMSDGGGKGSKIIQINGTYYLNGPLDNAKMIK